MPKKDEQKNIVSRPPVIAIMGHIDHGKSRLLDYIRKTNIVDGEAGGITQHIAAYEVRHKGKDGVEHKITFLDTPGHEAFSAIRARGTKVADIAVLVVSAEEGVKKQTLEALKCITDDKLPYIVAINKIDKPTANIDQTKQSLAENGIYIEGYGGTIPAVPISAKFGQGVDELLDMMLLVAELEELTGNPALPALGTVIESSVDAKKGVSATLIIGNGTLKKGEYIIAEDSFAPVRIMQDFMGKEISEASLGSPIRIIGWNKLPAVGAEFKAVKNKKVAEEIALEWKIKNPVVIKKPTDASQPTSETPDKKIPEKLTLPIILKADTTGSVEAIIQEIEKLGSEEISPVVMLASVGTISENDVKRALSDKDSVIIGFHTTADTLAENLANRSSLTISMFDVIYKLTEYIAEELKKRKPKVMVEEEEGVAKIQKVFSSEKNRQVVGGKVESGSLKTGGDVKIMRRELEIGSGVIRELQSQKVKTSEVLTGREFGTMIESKTVICAGDRVVMFTNVLK